MKAEAGYYWVKLKRDEPHAKWEIAYHETGSVAAILGPWLVLNSEESYHDNDMAEIGRAVDDHDPDFEVQE